MGKKWKNAPVMYTVAQVRFNQILSIENFVPAIQEKLRTIGFPDYRKEIINALTISIGQPGQQDAPPVIQPVSRFIFSNIESTSGFTLESNALSFQLTDYDVFESFLATFVKVLSIVHECVGLNFVERIGIRYLDAVLPRPGELLPEYLKPEVLGLSCELNGKLVHSYTETVRINEDTKVGLIARTIIRDAPLSLPPEITQTSYILNARFRDFKGTHAIIDNDAYLDELRMPFDTEKISKLLDDLHVEIAESFQKAATPKAIQIWKDGE
ncbi:MAG TPA: TIGR04255 family protein [Methylophilaceae bacterium]|nr:TIGR04255 family protein [Methylophilaceae bacterium]